MSCRSRGRPNKKEKEPEKKDSRGSILQLEIKRVMYTAYFCSTPHLHTFPHICTHLHTFAHMTADVCIIDLIQTIIGMCVEYVEYVNMYMNMGAYVALARTVAQLIAVRNSFAAAIAHTPQYAIITVYINIATKSRLSNTFLQILIIDY